MIRITDITLSCLDEYDASPELLQRLCALLPCTGADWIEVSSAVYRKIGALPENGKYILKLKNHEEMGEFPGFDRYCCRRNRFAILHNAILEIQINDIREINSLKKYIGSESLRITGMDDILSHDYTLSFEAIRNILGPRTELCPENRYYCATAAAVEWILQGGSHAAASFAGIGGKAALEEVLMALRLEVRHKPNMTYEKYPEIKKLLEEITGQEIPKNKAILGENIFNVEAGIHADGISKNPKIYEPFTPALVGNERRLIIGKHSGKASIAMKLKELNIKDSGTDLALLVQAVQKRSIEKQASLTDDEFVSLYYSLISSDGREYS